MKTERTHRLEQLFVSHRNADVHRLLARCLLLTLAFVAGCIAKQITQ